METTIDNTDVDFEVITEGVYRSNMKIVPDRVLVIRSDTQDILGLVSSRYKIKTHSEVLKPFNENPLLIQRGATVCKRGAIMFASYELTENGKTIEREIKVGDTIKFMIRAFNSYDGSMPAGFELYGCRLVCKNGMMVSKSLRHFSAKHFDKTLKDFDQQLSLVKENIDLITKHWKNWSVTKTTPTRINDYLNSLNMGNKLRETLLEDCVAENTENGIWGIFNRMTAYITHEMKSREEQNLAFSQRVRETEWLDKFYAFAWN